MPFFPGMMINGINNKRRYWVGGSAAWDATAGSKWSLTSGGTGGASVPDATTDVYLNVASGTVTVTRTGAGACKNLICDGFTGTLAGTGATTIAGSIALSTTMTFTFSGARTFTSTSGIQSIKSAGKTWLGAGTFNGVGGRWFLRDAYTLTNSATTVTNGTLDTNGQTLNLNSLSKGAAGNLVLGTSAITTVSLTATSGAGTVSAASSSITVTGSSFAGGGYTYGAVSLTGSNIVITGANIYNGAFSSTAGFSSASNLTFNSSITFSGTSQASRSLITTSTPTLASVTFTCNGSAPVITNVDFQGIIAAGSAGTWSGTNVGDCQGNSNITFTTPASPYFVGGGTVRALNANFWSTSSGGGVGAPTPLPQDTPILDSNSFTAGGGIDVSAMRVPTLDFTNATNNPSLVSGAAGNSARFYGDIKLKAGMSMTGNVTNQFVGYGITQTLNMAGITYPGSITCNIRNSGTLSSASTLDMSNRNIVMNFGNLNTGGFGVTCGSIAFTSTQSWTFSGNYTLTGSTAVLTTQTTTTVNCTGGLIDITDTSASVKTARFSNKTYNNLRIRGAAGSSVSLSDLGNITTTFNTITLDPLANFNPNGVNMTIQFNNLIATGSAGNLITMTGGQTYNFVSLSGTAVNCSFCAIDHSAASGAIFTATNSVNNGSNTGWTITP